MRVVVKNCVLCSLLWIVILTSSKASVQLYCQNDGTYEIPGANIKVEVKPLKPYGLLPAEPCAYDLNGKCFKPAHLSVASRATYFCDFKMTNYVVSGDGAIFQAAVEKDQVTAIMQKQVTFDHKTISGIAPSYYPEITNHWSKVIGKAAQKYRRGIEGKYDLVVPLRMPWDDCFNHLSFQIMPIIGTVYTLYHDIWDKLTFHTSMFSAALVNLLGVPMDRIVVQKPIYAKQLVLPWIPQWMPVQTASMYNISNEVSTKIIQRLITMTFDPYITDSLIPLRLSSPSHPDAKYEDFMNPADPYRYIAYITRDGQETRDVYKEQELLEMINKVIDKSKYRLIVVGHSHGYKSIEQLQASWSRFAKVLSKAIVMIGPHGGTSNNVMFTPTDCHVIEFNHLPEEHFQAGTTVIRSVFLTGFFAKGNTGKYYNIEPNNSTNKVRPDMYFEAWMKVAHRDVLLTLMQINKDLPKHDLLVKDINVNDFPPLSKADLAASTKKTNAESEAGRKRIGPDSKKLPPKPANYVPKDGSVSTEALKVVTEAVKAVADVLATTAGQLSSTHSVGEVSPTQTTVITEPPAGQNQAPPARTHKPSPVVHKPHPGVHHKPAPGAVNPNMVHMKPGSHGRPAVHGHIAHGVKQAPASANMADIVGVLKSGALQNSLPDVSPLNHLGPQHVVHHRTPGVNHRVGHPVGKPDATGRVIGPGSHHGTK